MEENSYSKAYISLHSNKHLIVIYFEAKEIENYARMLRKVDAIAKYFKPAINFRKMGGQLTWVDRVGDTWNYKHKIEVV